MWIIRFDKFNTKDYNFIKRHLNKAWFNPKKIAPVIFIKACIMHTFQNRSWRHISNTFNLNHIVLYNFYNSYKNTKELKIILDKLVDNWVILFLDELKSFNFKNIDQTIIDNTKKKMNSYL